MKPVALFLYCLNEETCLPWLEAGWECWIVDIQHPAGVHRSERGVFKVGADMLWWAPPRQIVGRIRFMGAFPPCDHLAVSGARWFAGKGLGMLSDAVRLFERAAHWCEWSEGPYFVENPVSNISSHWRKPDHSFSPEQFTQLCAEDNFTKKTCLWTGGGFVMPQACPDLTLGPPDDRIHKAPPGPDRANFRSKTPLGFMRAVFAANCTAHAAVDVFA
jgi:hypothetical protein